MCFGPSKKRAPLRRPGVTAIARAALFVNHAWLTNLRFFSKKNPRRSPEKSRHFQRETCQNPRHFEIIYDAVAATKLRRAFFKTKRTDIPTHTTEPNAQFTRFFASRVVFVAAGGAGS